MLTRRNFVTGAIATGALLRAERRFAKASQPSTPVNFEIPPHACDCHTHYYGDPKKFPLSPEHVIHTADGTLRGDVGASPRSAHRARRDRDAQRLRRRQ